MELESHYRKLERMYLTAPINAFFRPTIHVEDGGADVSIAVGKHLFHAAGAVHGSAYFKVMDDASFFAANSLVSDVFVLTVTFNVTLVRAVTSGEMRAHGRVVNRTGRLFFTESVLTNEAGVELGRGGGTFTRSKMALASEIGYA